MNKFQFTAYMFLVWAAFSFSGCAKDTQMYLEAKAQEPSLDLETESAAIDTEADSDTDKADETCFVYVCGAVKKPGVYELPSGSRIYEAINKAGGLKKNASVKGMNQAQILSDGDMVEILTMEEKSELEQTGEGGAGQAGNIPAAPGNTAGGVSGGRININTASAAELMTLNGIGEAKAANIIAYRESNGKFASTEELMNVNGIGKGVYANIQDKITVTQ